VRSNAAVIALTVAALIGFAANSLLCRAALGAETIDAASFTAIRIGAGALTLVALARGTFRGAGSWPSAGALFAYAAAFSFAYLRLTTATGALILFGTVQTTMIGWGVVRGARPGVLEWLGIAVAFGGLVTLLLPGLATPDPIGAAMMSIAGVAWGIYSLRGRGTTQPLAATADNFVRAVPMIALLLLVIPLAGGTLSAEGAVLAATSGAIASGIGYSLWYAALPQLGAVRAAVVQLSVPLLATGGGAAILGEAFTLPLAIATVAILGGIGLSVVAKNR
jgi:drug/metabolite transporter (DMT)-like permease